jgi:hypothetical protein
MGRAGDGWIAPLAKVGAALAAVALGCGTTATTDPGGLPNASATGDDAGAAPADASGPPALGGGTCAQPPPPTGNACACHYTSCHDCALECDCAADCYEAGRTDCLVTVDASGVPHTSDPLLASGTLSCTLVPGTQGEVAKPAQMVCAETSCTGRPPLPPAPGPGAPDGGGGGAGACPVPVPGPVVLPGPVWGDYQVAFRVPFPSYAFAAAHAAVAMQAVAPIGLHESPSAYFATALKESYLGCSDKLPPLDLYHPGQLYTRTASYGAGCLQIDSTSAWVQMCQMYPETFDCTKVAYADVIPSTNQDTTGRDNFASSVWVKAYYDTWAYGMLTTHHMPSPAAWFGGASDPEAIVKVLALLYNEGGWSGDATAVADGCQSNLIESCIGNKDYVVSVGSYTAQLEAAVAAGNCYDETVSVSDVDDYVARIAPLFANENAAALTTAGHQAFLAASGGATSAPFQQVAGAVILALQGSMQAKMHCPDAELDQYYKFHCPT